MSAVEETALLVVDVQNDFCAGGALAVPHADDVIPALNRHIEKAESQGLPVYATRDWHPTDTAHFAGRGGPWPPHCVQHTAGAEFHPSLHLPPHAIIITKGADPSSHGYSAFDGYTNEGVPLLSDLRARGIQRLLVGGLATDYCIRHSVLGALRTGFRVTLLTDAIAGVDEAASARAVAEMREGGAVLDGRRA